MCTFTLLSILTASAATRMQAEPNGSESPTKKSGESTEQTSEAHDTFGQKLVSAVLQRRSVRIFGQPYEINVLPLAFYNGRSGFNLGFNSVISPVDNPDLYRLRLQVMASVRGAHNHELSFEYPQIGDSRFGMAFQAEWLRDLDARYYGLGNLSVNAGELTDHGDPAFVSEDYYVYNFKRPRINVFGSYRVFGDLRVWLGYGLQKVEPQLKNGVATSFLGREQPFGHLGGSGNHISLRLSWDTRKDRIFPTSGFVTEFGFSPSFASVVVQKNGDTDITQNVTFFRYTLSDAHFVPLYSDRLILANRMAFESVTGKAPYYALGELADLHYTHVLGGSNSLRGFDDQRFHDNVKLLTLTELRLRLRHFELMAQSFDLVLVGFFDTGRVWPSVSDIVFNQFHTTVGGGIWLNWNRNLIVRLDVGRSKEQVKAYLRIGTAF